MVYKRPSDLALLRDVPVYANLCIVDGLLDDGLLAGGLVPAFKHALENLLLPDAVLMPASADVYMQVRRTHPQADARTAFRRAGSVHANNTQRAGIR